MREAERYLFAGDTGLYVNFSERDAREALLLARQLGQVVIAQLDGVTDVTPGMQNLLIHYDPLLTCFSELTDAVDALLDGLTVLQDGAVRHWRIPVLYGGAAGPDLLDVASATGLSADAVVASHHDSVLTVAIMGFLPGLAYMKGIAASLYLPRRASPRTMVPARSVGIAMDQTVIYPLASPGGWNLIGRTPFRPFDARRRDPVLFTPGDSISFFSVEQKNFDEMEAAAAHGETIVVPTEK